MESDWQMCPTKKSMKEEQSLAEVNIQQINIYQEQTQCFADQALNNPPIQRDRRGGNVSDSTTEI